MTEARHRAAEDPEAAGRDGAIEARTFGKSAAEGSAAQGSAAQGSAAQAKAGNGRARMPFALCVFLVFLVALALRSIQYLQTALIFTDSAHYVDMARMLMAGDVRSMLAHEYHPLFAVVIAGSSYVIPDMITGAMLSSVLAGALAVVPLALLFRMVGGPLIGIVAALGHALGPYPIRYAAAGQSEALYLLVFFTAIAFGLRALRGGGLPSTLLCAVSSGLAFLVRPEGAGVFAVVFGLMMLRLPWRWKAKDRDAVRTVLVCLVAFVLLGGSYIGYKYTTTGSLELSAKKSIIKMLGIGNEDEVPAAGARPDLGIGEMLARVVTNLNSSMSAPLAFFAVIGLVFCTRGRKKTAAELHLLAIFLAYVTVLLLLLNGYGYLSRRHATPVSALALGWSALGMIAFVRTLSARWTRRNPSMAGRATSIVTVVLALVVGGALVGKALKPQWTDQVALERAGLWLGERRLENPAMRVVTPYKWADPRIPVYAGVRIDQPTVSSSAELFSYLGGTRPDYLAIINTQLERRCSDPQAVRDDPRLELVHREVYEEREGREIEIYRFIADP